jgi:hypothetical protein
MTKPSSLTVIKFIVFSATLTVLALLGYDIFFSKPLIMQGIIVDKVYMPSKNAAGPNVLPYMRYKSYDYMVTSEKHEQWIAFVKTEQGQILKVNCHSHHYEQKHVGDTLHFKEYIGEIFGIDYFSHNEEDEELENALEIPSPVEPVQ